MSNGTTLAKKVQQFSDNIEEETERGLTIGVSRLVGEMKRHVARQRSIASGTLYRGLEMRDTTAQNPESYASRSIFGPDYWRYLEFGTGRYTSRGYKAPDPQPPRVPIYEWVVSKGILPDPDSRYETQWELAGAIAATMSTGTRQHKFARPAWRGTRGRDKIVEEVGDGVKRALSRF